jgi:hypothetical protein
MRARPGGSLNGEGIPRAWPPLFFYRQDGDRGAPGRPQDLKGFLTNDLIDYCSCRDKEYEGDVAWAAALNVSACVPLLGDGAFMNAARGGERDV